MHIPTGAEPQWYSVASLSELYAVMDKEPEKSVRLVAGNTGRGEGWMVIPQRFWVIYSI